MSHALIFSRILHLRWGVYSVCHPLEGTKCLCRSLRWQWVLLSRKEKKNKKHTLVDQRRNFPELPCLFLFHHSVAPQCFHIGSSLCSDTDVSCQHCVPEQGTWDKHASSPPKRLCLQLSGPHIFRARFRKNQVLLQAVQSSECINPLNLVPKEDVLHTEVEWGLGWWLTCGYAPLAWHSLLWCAED